MKRKVLLILAFSLLLVSIASANTEITVKTVPFGEISLNIRPQGSIDVVERFKETASPYGDASFTYSGSLTVFDLTYFIKKNDEKVANGIITNKEAGADFNFTAVPDGFEILYAPEPEPIVELNETNETEEIAEEESAVEEEGNETKRQKKITAFSIFKRDDGSMNWNFFYYLGGAIILALIIFFFLKTQKSPRGIKITKLSELKKDKKEGVEEQEKIIKEAEETIAKAKKRIKEIKSGDKISELQRRLEKDEEELKKLREREDFHEKKDDED